jgi:hypothetical protein
LNFFITKQSIKPIPKLIYSSSDDSYASIERFVNAAIAERPSQQAKASPVEIKFVQK